MNPVDTIAAIATGSGAAGIGVIRLSGPQALQIASELSHRQTFKPRFAHYVDFIDEQNRVLDQGLILYFPAPHSFTGEDVVELQGHGGPVILQLLLQRTVQLGARLARAGEFSERAFLNEKLDLAQAEAVADLIEASSIAAARAAMKSLQGDFSLKVQQLVEELIQQRIWVEAAFDFSDEDIDFHKSPELINSINSLENNTKVLLEQAKRSQKLREGWQIAIVGPPNAGKSSLLNSLSGRDSAIVTERAGTTRDLIREAVQFEGLQLELLDTAGLRQTDDPVEQEGIRRAQQHLQQADLVLQLQDASQTHALEAAESFAKSWLTEVQGTHWLILSQVDKLTPQQRLEFTQTRCVSVHSGEGLQALLEELQAFSRDETVEDSQFLARERHIEALQQALPAIQQAAQWLQQGQQVELVAEELNQAQQALSEITGRFSNDDLLGRIFSQFCIGK